MTLKELKQKVDEAVWYAMECDDNPETIPVTLQIDWEDGTSVFSRNDVELHYDNDLLASGCVITANGEQQ